MTATPPPHPGPDATLSCLEGWRYVLAYCGLPATHKGGERARLDALESQLRRCGPADLREVRRTMCNGTLPSTRHSFADNLKEVLELARQRRRKTLGL